MRNIKLLQAATIAVALLASTDLHAQQKLTKKAAAKLSTAVIQSVKASEQAKADSNWSNKLIKSGDKELKFEYKIFGEEPVDGRSLYISMHGGGNAPAELNDQQWRNQMVLYKPAEGVYVAPRAATNTWNLWHEEHIDDMFAELIRTAIITEGVNPNKVYIMGYSAGGDGTFQLAPRMADYWAASAMMAGHPGDASAVNLRNLPFAIYMGGKDAAFQRNEHAATWGKMLDSLSQAEPGSFIHETHIFPDMPHWMKQKDTIAVSWMAGFERNPLPSKVAWRQDDRTHSRFYWLAVPKDSEKAYATSVVSIEGNSITIEENDNETLYIHLNDGMLNLDKKVKVFYQGKEIFNAKVRRDASIIQETAARMDENLVFSARLVFKKGGSIE